MLDKTAWYLTVETTIDGERRAFSKQMRSAPPRHGVTVPPHVNAAGVAFIGSVLDGADLTTVAPHADHPYRFATYRLYRDGELVVSSVAGRPVRPSVDTD